MADIKMPEKFKSISEAIIKGSKEHPDRLCVSDMENTYTYRQFCEKACSFCDELKEKGIKKGECVVVKCTQDANYLALQMALQMMGCVFVPLEKSVSDEQFNEIKELVKDVRFSDDTSEILFTTGTTGKSKGVVLSHAACVAVAQNVADAVKMEKGNVEIIPTPLNHSFSLRRYYADMIMGGSVIVLNGVLNIKKYFEAIEKYKVTSLVMVPATITAVLKLSKKKLADYAGTLKFIQVGSAPMTDAQKEGLKSLLPNLPMYNIFGSTEAGCATYFNFNSEDDYPGCIGRATLNSKILFADEDGALKESASKDAPGRIVTGGDMIMDGYFKDKGETAKALKNNLIYSEDLGYLDDKGNICVMGRAGFVINVKGHKVAPEEVEGAALKHPLVEDCAVCAMDDAEGQKAVKLLVVMKKGEDLDPIEIRNFLAGRLESYKLPKAIVKTDKIPRTFNGKIQRNILH